MVNKLLLIAVSFSILKLYAQQGIQDTTTQFSFSTISEYWDQMDDIFNDPSFSNAHWGVVVQSLETGEYFYKRNENKLFMPASNLKLFTTAAGLNILGSNYRFSTNLFLNGRLDGSILVGDLVVQGRGDPTISGRFYNNRMYKVLTDWADSLILYGIDEIDGNIIGDDNEFDEKGLGDGWSWDYESYWFAAQSSAISFNDNCVDVIVTVDENTNLPKISISPETKYVVVLNKVITVPEDSSTSIDVYREQGTNVINIFGSIKLHDSVKTFVTVNNPTQYSLVILKQVLEAKGIKVTGFPMDVDDMTKPLDYSAMQALFKYYSPELKEIVKVINKNSQNFFAEQLMKTIGLEIENYGSIENGVLACNDIFKDMGIDPENIVIVDGSGLSRLNYVTPMQVVSLLSYMFKSENFIPFFNSLPIAGVDGTLGNRMKNTKAAGNIRAKTGFIGNVRSLSGYAYTGDNEPVAFSIIVNNFNVPVKLAENIQDLVCVRLANFKRK